MEPFKTVDLYPLMCQLLGIDPHPNNGSLENVKAVLKDPSPSGIVQFVPMPKLDLISLVFAIVFTLA